MGTGTAVPQSKKHTGSDSGDNECRLKTGEPSLALGCFIEFLGEFLGARERIIPNECMSSSSVQVIVRCNFIFEK